MRPPFITGSAQRLFRVRLLLPAALVAVASACAAIHGPKPVGEPAPQPAAVPVDASLDWHVLLPSPFGSALKEVPLSLHEVLLFRDDEHRATPSDEPECYATGAAPPRFIGKTATEYLVCFKQDRLIRIQAAAAAPAAEAPILFAAACTLWLKNAAESGAPAAAAVAPIPADATECEGRDGAVHFSGRLAAEPDADSTMSIVLDSPPDRQ